jgi:DNA invertase Pin-like site-specific DNA recombinase
MTTTRAIGIVRVSQRTDDSGHSPEVQARALLKQAGDERLTLSPADIWDENLDANGHARPASAGAQLIDRPRLREAVEAVESGEAVAIIAERFDRLFRDLDVQREVIRRVENAGGRLITAAGAITHATAEAELHANLNGSIAQYTKRTAMERSRAAVQLAIDEGKVPWPGVTPGYVRLDSGTFAPGPLAPVVAEAFRLRCQPGVTLENVRTYLRANGLPNLTLRRTQTLLKSRVVRGEINFKGYTSNLTAFDAIVDEQTWQRAQNAVEPRGRQAKSERLLSRLGVLRCGSCGGTMVINTGKGQYRCASVNECSHRVAVGADRTDAEVVAVVREALANVEGRASVEQDAADAERDLERAVAAFNAAVTTFDGMEAEPVVRERLIALRDERDRAMERVEHLRRQSAALAVNVADDWDRLTLDERRALIRATVERVDVGAGRGADRITVHLFSE